MRILITGATGLIGRRLVKDRLDRGDELVIVSRDARRAKEVLGPAVTVVEGNVTATGAWQQGVDGCDVVVHLAGTGIAERRWNSAYKKEIVDSRIESTRRVVEAFTAAPHRPAILINASASGYYGDRGEETLDEGARPGDDFLANVCVQWEAEARRAEETGARVVMLRTGVVLDERGGALRSMLPAFRMMVGGPIGSGRQYFPWVHWRDVVGLVELAISHGSLRGPLNVVAPEPATARQFARALGAVLHRPAFLPVPVLALRVVLGELAQYAAASLRMVPAAAQRQGYAFTHRLLRPALASLVG